MLSQGASLSKQEIWRRMKRGLRSAASTARGLAESWASAQVAQTATIITSSHITLGELDEAMATRKLFHKLMKVIVVRRSKYDFLKRRNFPQHSQRVILRAERIELNEKYFTFL